MKKLFSLILFSLITTAHAEDPALPWTAESVQKAMKVGTTVVYHRKGKEQKKGKEKIIDDQRSYQIAKVEGNTVHVAQMTQSQAGKFIPSGSSYAPWSEESPFFNTTGPEFKILRQETIKVSAGTFDCVVVEITGFGGKKTVWMIKQIHGIYAKMIEDDPFFKTYAVYELVSIKK